MAHAVGRVAGIFPSLREKHPLKGSPMTSDARKCLALICCCLFAGTTLAQDADFSAEFDQCGELVQGANCVLFSGGGGRFYLSDYGSFRVGDSLRVVGAASTDCATFCDEIEGCITVASLHDPAVLPCGTPIPNLPADITAAAFDGCTAALAGGALALTLGLCSPLWRPKSLGFGTTGRTSSGKE